MGSTGINPLTGLPWTQQEMEQANQQAGQNGYYVSTGGGAFAPQATPTLDTMMQLQQSFANNPYLSSPAFLEAQARAVAGGNPWVDANSNLTQDQMAATIYSQLRPDDPTIQGMSQQDLMSLYNAPGTGMNAPLTSYGIQQGPPFTGWGNVPSPATPPGGGGLPPGGGGGAPTPAPPNSNPGLPPGSFTPPVGPGTGSTPGLPPIGGNGSTIPPISSLPSNPPLSGGPAGTGNSLPPIKFGPPYLPTIPGGRQASSTRSALAQLLATGKLPFSPFYGG